ncbi:MAG: hypothetical protein RL701_3057 [Pseudomonadota bacterium]
MTLRQLDRDLYCVDHAWSMLGLHLGLRTTVVRLPEQSVVVHSPGPLTDEDARAIDALGPVSALIAPNLMHHLYLAAAHARWPKAAIVAPAGLKKKQPSLPLAHVLTGQASDLLPAAFAGALEPLYLGGMPRLEEYAWHHPSSGTLIATDLAFNVRAPQPLWTRLFLRVNNGWDHFGPTRVVTALMKDRNAVHAGLTNILTRDFDRVIVAHGDVEEQGGHRALRTSYAWLLDREPVAP